MHVLGIDAGGTKTVCYRADADGTIVGEGRGGGANLHVHGELELEKVLYTVIDQAQGEGAAPAALCLGLAGMDREDDQRLVRAILRRLGFRHRVLIVNDALVALVAGLGHEPGIVVVSGTGSIVYGVSVRGRAARAGGWGHILADEGSGAWIGRRALVAVMREADGRGPHTSLTPMVLEHFNVSKPDGLVREIYDRAVTRLALTELAALVGRAHSGGDPIAAAILDDAARELAAGIRPVATRLEMQDDPFVTVLGGGMFKALPYLAAEVERHLGTIAPRSVARTLQVEPAVGAVRLALRAVSGDVQLPVYVDPPARAPA